MECYICGVEFEPGQRRLCNACGEEYELSCTFQGLLVKPVTGEEVYTLRELNSWDSIAPWRGPDYEPREDMHTDEPDDGAKDDALEDWESEEGSDHWREPGDEHYWGK
jgi:hypothetical protein